MIPLFKVFMADEAKQEVSKVLDSGYVGQGPKIEEFEKTLKSYFNNDYVLTMNSCTSALQLAVYMLKPEGGWCPNDEIIVTPLTCFATISAIIANGVKVRWADVDPRTCNIDLEDVERKVGPHTKGVMLVHWGGCPIDMNYLKDIQNKYFETYNRHLEVIEDCAHCWDTKFNHELIGNSGNYCCFSFQAIKFLNTGDGGLMIAPSNETYKRAKLLRWFGLDRDAGASFRCIQDIRESGFKYQANDIAAAIGLANFPYMQNNVKRHKEIAQYYLDNLKDCDGIEFFETPDEAESSYWLFTIKVQRRKDFIKYMESCGIATSPVHARCDKHSSVKEYKSLLPGMDYLEELYCAIPCGWWMKEDEPEYIVDCIKKGW